MKKIKVEIQMYYADCFQTIVDKKEFENDLRNVELGNTILVKIIDTKGDEHWFNPKYVSYINYSKENENE